MNKNTIIGIVGVVIVIVAGAFFIFKGEKSEKYFDVSLLDKDETELTKMNEDVEAFLHDNLVVEKTSQTFSDILDEGTGISAAEALDEYSISQEASQADILQTLNAFAADEDALGKLDQTFSEISQ